MSTPNMVRRYLHETDSITAPSLYYQPARSASERLSRLMNSNVFEFPKDETVLNKFIEMATDSADTNCIVMNFFAGSGTTGHAVMLQNATDGGNRQFILVQVPQPIDAKKQKEAYSFVTETLGKPEATIFEITAERLLRAGTKIEAEQAEKAKAAALQPAQLEGFAPEAGAGTALAATVDTGFRVFDLVDDPEALILKKPLQQATQADVLALQASIATPAPAGAIAAHPLQPAAGRGPAADHRTAHGDQGTPVPGRQRGLCGESPTARHPARPAARSRAAHLSDGVCALDCARQLHAGHQNSG